MNFHKGKKVSEPGTGFNSKGLGLRVQKKLASSMSSKSMAKHFIDEAVGQLLDNVYNLIKEYSGEKKQAEKIVKYLIKLTIKIAIAYRNDQFDRSEIELIEEYKRKFKNTIMTVVSFVEVDFSFDKTFMRNTLQDNAQLLHRILDRHSTEKTQAKLDRAFNFLSNPEFLEEIFRPESKHRPLMTKIAAQLDSLMESGTL